MKIKESFFIHESEIICSNSKLNPEVVEKIVSEGINPQKLWALPGIFTTKWFLITDGNHRLEAMRRLWQVLIPIIILDPDEYEVVAHTKNEIPFLVKAATKQITLKEILYSNLYPWKIMQY